MPKDALHRRGTPRLKHIETLQDLGMDFLAEADVWSVRRQESDLQGLDRFNTTLELQA